MIIVNEKFSESMPSWIASNIKKANPNMSLAKYYDFHNAEFHEESVPTSNRDKRLKDLDRINFFLFDTNSYDGNRLAIYYNNHWVTPLKNWEFRSWTDIVDHTVKYAYCDINSRNNADELRNVRQELKKGAVALQRVTDDWYGSIDKSGYIVDRDKYVKLLSTKKLNVYISDLDKINRIIDKSKSLINDYINNMSDPYKVDTLVNLALKNDPYEYTDGPFNALRRLLSIASNLNKAIARVKKGEPASKYSYVLDELPTYVDRANELYSIIDSYLGV